jgi:hypothetical protein
MYAESWGPSYATNKGQYRGSDHYMIQYSFGYSNATSAGSPNPQAAVYQARNDILWPANSAKGFCSSLLGYTTPVVTVTSATTTTPVSVTLQTVTITSVGGTATATSVITTSVTITSAVNVKREIGDSAEPTSLTVINGVTAPALLVVPSVSTQVPSVSTQVPQKRALSTPNVLTKYLGGIVTSACSLAIKPVISTNTVTVASTQTANTVLITQQFSVTTLITSSIIVAITTTTTQVLQCTPAYKFVVADGPRPGQHIIEAAHSAGAIDDGLLKLTLSATAAGKFILGTDGQVQSSDGQYVWTKRYVDVSSCILAVNSTAQSAYGLASVLCSIVSPAPAGVTGVIGTLSCQNGGSQVHLITASQRDIYLMQTDTSDSTEALLTVAFVPIVSCSQRV